ncbi:PhoX family protein [Anthocerotibacter panamensis]|uniref:PhoX family protein n=1 Tax=Anthocerotibacter panamensis TaxID=2857077 RepID=UPI001C4020E9|nr:alkaline phosphatase PhoX [Anthocerotibacter panamensis]
MREQTWYRREFLQFLGYGAATIALSEPAQAKTSPFKPIPLKTGGLPFQEAVSRLTSDELTLPAEFTYQVVVKWGDPLTPQGRTFGYNNDFTAFVPLSADEGLLWANHEYVNEETYRVSYPQVFGKPFPTDPQARIALYKQELGGSVVHLKLNGRTWGIVPDSPYNRRLDAHTAHRATGPAQTIFTSPPVGTFANCSGGATPWGTVLSCEENFQSYVPEVAFLVDAEGKLTGRVGTGGPFQLPGEHYGWVVEVDPRDPQSAPVKHTALGRFRHENITLRLEEGKPLVAYLGDDREGGHVWRYVSQKLYRKKLSAQAKSRLFTEGTLWCARFDPQGKPDPETGLVMAGGGRWIPLQLDTPLHPNTPSQTVDLPDNLVWNEGTYERNNGQPARVLGDLYSSLGAALIDATRAAHALGGTPCGRPEDLEVHPRTRQVFIAFTSTSNADTQLLDPSRPNDPSYLFDRLSPELRQATKAQQFVTGQVWKIDEGADVTSPDFRWARFVARPDQLGFAMPDNLLFDSTGNLWLATDVSTANLNDPDSPLGRFGNNALYVLPTDRKATGQAHRFACGPVECELTGPSFTPDETTLFLSVQHPGERTGIRTEGKTQDSRGLPLGSNWPSVGQVGVAPRPAVVAITRRA